MGYVFTAIGAQTVSDNELQKVTEYLETLPIKINKTVILSPNKAYDFEVSLKLSGSENSEEAELFQKIRENLAAQDIIDSINIVFQKNDETRQDKKLFCFDMDSTLIYQEVIELIAEYANVQDQVEEITTRAMNGELDFKQSLYERVALLKGIDGNIWEDLKGKLHFTKGVKELTKGLKKKGVKLAVLSGGFIELAEYVKSQLSLDYAFANKLDTEVDARTGKLVFNGKTVGYIVDGEKKAELTAEIAEKEDIDLSRVVCVGDGTNDLPMMAKAGFGIAWNAKPKVQKLAPSKLNSDTMTDVFYIMGFNDEQISELIA